MKKVVVINSSPRKNGNSEVLSDAVVQGVQDAGGVGVKINMRELSIHPCKGCYACQMGHGDPCVQKDDMKTVYEALADAGAIVFATPLYWMQMNGPMKDAIDRLFAMVLHWGDRKRETALIVSAATAEDYIFSQIEPYFRTSVAGVLHWEVKGVIKAGGLSAVGDAAKSEHQQSAYALGKALAQE